MHLLNGECGLGIATGKEVQGGGQCPQNVPILLGGKALQRAEKDLQISQGMQIRH